MKQNGMNNIDVAILRDELAGTGCTVEVTRCCVWISGNTYPLRGALKRAGWKYSGKRRAWWKPAECGAEYSVHADQDPAAPETDYTLAGIRDGRPVIVAECTHIDGRGDDGFTDLAGRLDYDLGY